MSRDADIRGMVLPNTPADELASIHAALVAGLADGSSASGDRPGTATGGSAAGASERVLEPGAFGKIVLKS